MANGHRCKACRRSHLKCNGVRPSCEKCTSRGVQCEYDAAVTLTPPAPNPKTKLATLPTPSRTDDSAEKLQDKAEKLRQVDSDEEFVDTPTTKAKFPRCVPCRKSHLGCDRLKPICTRCLSSGKKCSYRQDIVSSKIGHSLRKLPTLVKYADSFNLVTKNEETENFGAVPEAFPSSALFDELNDACYGHLEFLGMREYERSYDPSALLMLGLIAEKLQKKYLRQDEG
jgi:hypothetical protein